MKNSVPILDITRNIDVKENNIILKGKKNIPATNKHLNNLLCYILSVANGYVHNKSEQANSGI